MKRLTNLFSLLAFSLVILSSCGDKKDTPSPNPFSGPNPTLVFTAKPGYTTSNKSVVITSETIKIAWVATKNEKELKTFTVTLNDNNYIKYNNGLPYSIPSDKQNTYEDSIQFQPLFGKYGDEFKFVFSVTDIDGNTTSQTITLIGDRPVVSYPNGGIIGGQSNTTYGSFSNYTATNLYYIEDAKSNFGNIDFVYYYGTTTQATLAAPNNVETQLVYNDATNGIPTWNSKNATKFKLTSLTEAQFDELAHYSKIVDLTNSGITNSSISNLVVGNVIAFITANGKRGVFKVTSITSGPTGSIKIHVLTEY